MSNLENFDVVVIGGGFYGCSVALELKKRFSKVIIIEKESDLMLRASLINQARVHNGYHYPRNIITAYRSYINFPIFIKDFKDCIVDDFIKLYAIAKTGSKVNAYQFNNMFTEIGSPIIKARPKYQHLFNQELVEDVFEVKEFAFDAVILKNIMKEKLDATGVKLRLETTAIKINPNKDNIEILLENGDCLQSTYIFNCTYSQINNLMKNSQIELLPMKHELTEMALIEMPDELKKIGVTVMDGPFFSTMPYPSKRLHSLSHVRYTPHFSWVDQENFLDGHNYLKDSIEIIKSNFIYMLRDSQRYIPALNEAKYVESIYEIKTVLLQNEGDDGRPILYRENYGINNLINIMGGKIDNIFDILDRINETKQFSTSLVNIGE